MFLFFFHLKGKQDILELFKAAHFSVLFIMYEAFIQKGEVITLKIMSAI